MQREDGRHTANAEDVHALVEESRIQIFKMHELGTQPTGEQYERTHSCNLRMYCHREEFKKHEQTQVLQEWTGGGLRNCKHSAAVV